MSLSKEIILSKIKSSFIKANKDNIFSFIYSELFGFYINEYNQRKIQYYFLPFKIKFYDGFYDSDNEVTIYFRNVEYSIINNTLDIYER